ncbi:MAG: bifunctional pantoate--beta-alanine ligase/(d)CMP kinase [Cyanobacteriota bacterium]|nr:bifunctional pantoate--beta-alanine ligase/(d)CMP kinase [Cyanobacteriota bacterium]
MNAAPAPLLTTAAALMRWCQAHRGSCPLHFVPTMGALHAGHQQLIARAARSHGPTRPAVLVSVFVNPLQFGAGEDYSRYPRQLQQDLQTATEAGATALWAPEAAAIYPDGPDAVTRIVPPAELSGGLCGGSRPGHFEGVATVVARLLALVRPDRLFLGEKDWQQLLVLRRMVADLGLPVRIEACGTVRDGDGLALSSRNAYLSPAQRLQALALPQALRQAATTAATHGSDQGQRLTDQVRQQLEAAGLATDYVALVAAHTLKPLPRPEGLTLLAAAVHCGPARLIDHVFVMSRAPIVAIDGPAGAGKSTVTKAFAARLGLVYLDTGAMYRALTWWVQHQGADPADAAAVEPLLMGLDLQLGVAAETAAGGQRVSINGHDVTAAIRSPEVTAQVSTVAAHACVRAALTAQQQAMGQRGGLVAEGRDIGTAVFPDAELKVFLTATVAERARRRALDLEQRGFAVPALDELEAQIAERDHLDSTRAVAPLLQAADAIELVTDGMAIETVIQSLVDLFRQRVPEDAWPG